MANCSTQELLSQIKLLSPTKWFIGDYTMKDNCAVNRAKLVDEPIVEMLLSRKYLKSGIRFMKSDLAADFEGSDIICYSNGVKRNYNIKRNSSKYFRSPNFTMAIDKNNLGAFNNTSYVFIDEVADSLYIVDGLSLLKYILEHKDNINMSSDPNKKPWVLLPKSDMILLVNDKNNIIRYNKSIAHLLSIGRDESQFANLS